MSRGIGFCRSGSTCNFRSMKTLLQPDALVLVPESDEERVALAAWKAAHDGFAFAAVENAGTGATLTALGPRVEACREPINVTGNRVGKRPGSR